MKKIVAILILSFIYNLSFTQVNFKVMDLRDAFIGTYKPVIPSYGIYPFVYHIYVEKILTSTDSLIIHDSLWSTGATTGCPVNCYQHRVKLNPDSTWIQYSQYYGHFKKTDTIYLHFFMPGSPPTVYDYYCKRISSVGINDLSESPNKVTVYPNPATKDLYIISSENYFEDSEIEIINYLGQTVLKTEHANTIDVSKLAQGIYTLKIVGKENQSYYSKFVKE